MNLTGKNYEDMTREELERELQEAFLNTDRIDDPLNEELEKMRETLDRKWPVEYMSTPEEAWERFLADMSEELSEYFGAPGEAGAAPLPGRTGRGRLLRPRAALRRAVLMAMILVLLAGAVFAAGPRLWVWVRGWNATEQYVNAEGAEAAGPIPAALAELGISEPVYPARLPDGFVLTEAHISEDPLILYELYTW